MEKEVFLWLGLMILFLVVETCHSRTDQYLACRRCVDRIICCSCRSNSCMAVYCVYRGISSAPDFYEAFCNEIYQQAS